MIRLDRLHVWTRGAERLWSWWVGELAGLLPIELAARLRGRPRADIRLARDKVEMDIVAGTEGRTLVEEKAIEDFSEENWQELNGLIMGKRIRLFLDPQRTHLIRFNLPSAAAGNLAHAIALQLPLLSPIQPDHVAWAWRIAARTRTELAIEVLIARLTYVEDIAALFDTEGLPPPPIYGQAGLERLLLKPGKQVRLDFRGKQLRLAQWIGIALFCSMPFTTLIVGWLLALANEREARALREELAPRLRAERIARHDVHVREVMRPVAAQPLMSAGLNAIVPIVPESAYIETLSLEEGGRLAFNLAGDIRPRDRKAIAETLGKSHVREVGDTAADAPAVAFEMQAP